MKTVFYELFFLGFFIGCAASSERLLEFSASVRAIGFDTDGKLMAVGLSSGTINIIPMDKANKIYVMDTCPTPISAIALDLPMLVVGYDDGLVLKRSLVETEIYTCRVHRAKISTIKMEKSFFVTGSFDKTICIWERLTGELLHNVNVPSEVTALAIDQATKLIYIGCVDGAVYSCNPNKNPQEIVLVTQRRNKILSLAARDKYLYVSSLAGSSIFDLAVGNVVELRANSPVQAFMIDDNARTITGACRYDFWFMWDNITGGLIDVGCGDGQLVCPTYGPVAISHRFIANTIDKHVYVRAAKQPCSIDMIVSNDTGLSLGPVTFADNHGYVVGKLLTMDPDRSYKVTCLLRNIVSDNDNCVTATIKYGSFVIFNFSHNLSQIKKVLLTRNATNGNMMVKYLALETGGGLSVRDAYPLTIQGEPFYLSSRPVCNTELYSWNVPLRDAIITGSCLSVVQGDNSGGQGLLWHFQGLVPSCHEPCILSVLTDTHLHTWKIPYLTDQSELFISEQVPSINEAHFLKSLKARYPATNFDDQMHLMAAIDEQRANGIFVRLLQYVEHTRQQISIPFHKIESLVLLRSKPEIAALLQQEKKGVLAKLIDSVQGLV